jgi:hypothetical protein
MNDLKPGARTSKRGALLFVVGLSLLALPFLCLVIMVISTGHAVEGSAEATFFWLVYLGLLAGFITVPIGLVLLIVGIVQMFRPR